MAKMWMMAKNDDDEIAIWKMARTLGGKKYAL